MSIDPEGFPVEADRLAVALDLDYSVDSVGRVQEWLRQNRAEPLAIAAGCYVGEVLRRNIGGTWQADGALAGVGSVVETFPLAKARAGEDLTAYVADVLRYAR